MRNRIKTGLVTLAVAAPLAIGGTAVGGVVTAEPAEAATVIRSNCYRYYEYQSPMLRCWVDYSWAEEVFQRKRDCYCHTEPILYWPPR